MVGLYYRSMALGFPHSSQFIHFFTRTNRWRPQHLGNSIQTRDARNPTVSMYALQLFDAVCNIFSFFDMPMIYNDITIHKLFDDEWMA